MSFDSTKSFEVDNGVVLSQDGPGIFSDSTLPNGSDAPDNSIFVGNDNILWSKNKTGLNGWRLFNGYSAIKKISSDHVLQIADNYSYVVPFELFVEGTIEIDGTLGVL